MAGTGEKCLEAVQVLSRSPTCSPGRLDVGSERERGSRMTLRSLGQRGEDGVAEK